MPKRFLQCVISDLDSTLRNTKQRHHLAPKKGAKAQGDGVLDHVHADWLDYAMACAEDVPMMGPIMVLRMARAHGHAIHIVSGCSEEARSLTEAWLYKHDVPFDTLRMHSAHDVTNNAEYKIQHVHYLQERGFEPILFLEDWPSVARQIERETGVPVLLVNPDYEDTPMGEFEKTW